MTLAGMASIEPSTSGSAITMRHSSSEISILIVGAGTGASWLLLSVGEKALRSKFWKGAPKRAEVDRI